MPTLSFDFCKNAPILDQYRHGVDGMVKGNGEEYWNTGPQIAY